MNLPRFLPNISRPSTEVFPSGLFPSCHLIDHVVKIISGKTSLWIEILQHSHIFKSLHVKICKLHLKWRTPLIIHGLCETVHSRNDVY